MRQLPSSAFSSISKMATEFTTLKNMTGSSEINLRSHSNCRLGRIGSLCITEELTYPTPNYFIHTSSGSIPHMTPEVFHMSADQTGDHWLPILLVSVESTFTFHENVKPSGQNISQFVGLPKCPSYLTVHNPILKPLSGYNDKTGISIWPRTGRVTLNSSKFLQIVSNFQPSLFQCPSDFDVDKLSSSKRVKKSTQRTLEFFHEILNKNDNRNMKIIATIETGWFFVDKEEGNRTVATMLENRDRLAGFVINGMKNFNQGLTDITVLSEILAKLPIESPKIVHGAFQLYEIIDMVHQGVDLFDSSIVTTMTEEGNAFGFSLDDFFGIENQLLTKTTNEDLSSCTDNNHGSSTIEVNSHNELIISLKDKRFYNDFRPILAKCACYTCRKYTRSYIHHLFMTGELLGLVLLMSHNLFHFDRFFRTIRLCLDDAEKINLLEVRLRPAIEKTVESETKV